LRTISVFSLCFGLLSYKPLVACKASQILYVGCVVPAITVFILITQVYTQLEYSAIHERGGEQNDIGNLRTLFIYIVSLAMFAIALVTTWMKTYSHNEKLTKWTIAALIVLSTLVVFHPPLEAVEVAHPLETCPLKLDILARVFRIALYVSLTQTHAMVNAPSMVSLGTAIELLGDALVASIWLCVCPKPLVLLALLQVCFTAFLWQRVKGHILYERVETTDDEESKPSAAEQPLLAKQPKVHQSPAPSPQQRPDSPPNGVIARRPLTDSELELAVKSALSRERILSR